MIDLSHKVGLKEYQPNLSSTFSKPKWTNRDNILFYEEAASGLLQKLAVLGGLHTCCDLKIFFPYIKNCKSVLEIGAGYGRVLDFLISKSFAGKIFAIERSKEFSKILQEKFSDSIYLFNKDLRNFLPTQKFDAILWLWSGIADFAEFEQPAILKKISSFLSEDGVLILDSTPPLRKPINSIEANGSEYTIKLGTTIGHVYCISNKQIKNYAKASGFKKTNHINYKTTANRSRKLHFLYK